MATRIVRNLSVVRVTASVLLCGLLRTQAPAETPKMAPIVSVDLADNDLYRHYRDDEAQQIPQAQLAFISETKVAVTFFTAGYVSGPMPNHPNLVSIFVNTASKTIEKTLIWSTPYGRVIPLEQRWLLPTTNGEFLVNTGAKLLRYSADLQILQERTVSDPNRTRILISPDRNLLLVSEFEGPSKFRESVLKTSDLKDEKVFAHTDRVSSGIGDDGRVLRLSFHHKEPSAEVSGCIQYRKDDFKKTCGTFGVDVEADGARICNAEESCVPVYTRSSHPALSNVVMVNNGLVFADIIARHSPENTHGDWGFAVLEQTGKILYKNQIANTEGGSRAGLISCAVAVPRFSFSTAHIAFGKDGLDWFQDVHVFDVLQMRLTLDLHFEGHGASKFRPLDAPISPDGTKLAVLLRNAFELYRVP